MDRLDRLAWLVCVAVGWFYVRGLFKSWGTMRVYRQLFDLCKDKGWTVELYPDGEGLVLDVREDGDLFGDLFARGRGTTAEDAAVKAATDLALSGRLAI